MIEGGEGGEGGEGLLRSSPEHAKPTPKHGKAKGEREHCLPTGIEGL